MNKSLTGNTLRAIHGGNLKKVRAEIGDAGLYESALSLIGKALDTDRKERLYLGGTSQLMEQPEFQEYLEDYK